MKTPTLLLTLALTALPVPSVAHAAKPHVHGVATLQVVADGKTLELRFESPLENLVGFERGPRNDKERQQIRDLAAKWRQSNALFAPTTEAQCKARDVTLTSAVIEPTLLLPADALVATPSKNVPVAASDHADLNAIVRFHCDNPGALKGIDVRLFSAYSRLRQLNVEIISATKQSAVKLTPAQTLIKW